MPDISLKPKNRMRKILFIIWMKCALIIAGVKNDDVTVERLDIAKCSVYPEVTHEPKPLVVIMFGNSELNDNFTDASHESFNAVINFAYAQKYNYTFIYYYAQLLPYEHKYISRKTQEIFNFTRYGCKNSKSGMRHAAWCKIIMIHDALKHVSKGSRVFYIDNDAAFIRPDVSIDMYLANAPSGLASLSTSPALIVSDNWPYSSTIACTGNIFL